jgi:hypothetical protein
MVTDKNRERWEEDSVDHQNWLMKSAQQALQTSTWFEDEFYDEIGADAGPAMDAGAMDAGAMDAGAMDAGAMNAGAMNAGTIDHSAMGHGRNMRTGQRFLQDAESIGGMDGMNMTSMVAGMCMTSMVTSKSSMGMVDTTGTSDSTSGVDLPDMTSSSSLTMDMGDGTTAMNMTGMASSTSSMSMNGTSMDTVGPSTDTSMGEVIDHSTSMPSSATAIASEIYRAEADGSASQESSAFYEPVWQMSPPPKDPSLVSLDLDSNPVCRC